MPDTDRIAQALADHRPSVSYLDQAIRAYYGAPVDRQQRLDDVRHGLEDVAEFWD